MPDRLMELVLVQVAHFEPVQVQVLVEGTYPSLTLNLPRVRDALLVACAEEARHALDTGPTANTLAVVGPAVPRAAGRPGSGVTAVSGGQPAGRAGSVAGTAVVRSQQGPGSVAGSMARSQVSGVSGAGSARSRASGSAAALSAAALAARDRAARATAGLTAEKRLELEAERARLVQLLLDPAVAASASAEVAAMVATAQAAAAEALAAAAALAPQPSVSDASDSEQSGSNGGRALSVPRRSVPGASAAAMRRLPPAPKLPAVASAHYVLDFGYATKGVNKTRKVKVTNTSVQQVQFLLDRPLLEAFGFGVSEASVKLAGAPACEVRWAGWGMQALLEGQAWQPDRGLDGVVGGTAQRDGPWLPYMAVPLLHTPPQTAELTFTLLTAKGAAQPGPVEVTVPLTLRAGCADSPAVLLTLRAHVVLPDITTSTSTLDFGTVCNAHCKVAGARGERARGPLELGCVTSSAYAAQKSEPVA